MNNLKQLIRLEEVVQFVAAVYLLIQMDYDWWWFLLLALGPDISMIAYRINSKMGSYAYNLFHHKGLALAILALGWFTKQNQLYILGIILYGHSSMDRVFGYGLKYKDSFFHTHLGWIKEPENT